MINTRQLDLAIVFQQEKILRWSARPILEERLFLIGTHDVLAPFPKRASRLASWPLSR
jgi:LysR family tcuABC transcriptional regulator